MQQRLRLLRPPIRRNRLRRLVMSPFGNQCVSNQSRQTRARNRMPSDQLPPIEPRLGIVNDGTAQTIDHPPMPRHRSLNFFSRSICGHRAPKIGLRGAKRAAIRGIVAYRSLSGEIWPKISMNR